MEEEVLLNPGVMLPNCLFVFKENDSKYCHECGISGRTPGLLVLWEGAGEGRELECTKFVQRLAPERDTEFLRGSNEKQGASVDVNLSSAHFLSSDHFPRRLRRIGWGSFGVHLLGNITLVHDPMNAVPLPANDTGHWAGGSPPRRLRVSHSL